MTGPMHDQALAAFDDAARQISTMETVGVDRSPLASRVLSRWLHSGESNRLSYKLEPWTSCSHLDTPQLCYGLGNLPGHLMCGDCLRNGASAAPDECDWCGMEPRRDPRYKLFPAVQNIGPAVVIFSLCAFCLSTPDRNMPAHEVAESLHQTLIAKARPLHRLPPAPTTSAAGGDRDKHSHDIPQTTPTDRQRI